LAERYCRSWDIQREKGLQKTILAQSTFKGLVPFLFGITWSLHVPFKLHTRERWLSDGLQVKAGETPVKIQKKTVPKMIPGQKINKSTRRGKSDMGEYESLVFGHGGNVDDAYIEKTSEYFGDWQTEPYAPPNVQNGQIPVNRFNNVYMFRPFMAPIGSIHLTST